MARFQALTNNLLDGELEMLRDRLGLETSQKAELLREVASLAAWVIRQTEQGRTVEARRGKVVEPLAHPALDRLRATRQTSLAEHITLDDAQVVRLAAVLDRGWKPSPALRRAIANLASPKRRPPKLRWKNSAA
jgi:hypothetical protein